MKKVIMVLSLFFLFVAYSLSSEPLSTSSVALNVTTKNYVYAGVSSANVRSSIVPSTNLSEITFKYVPDSKRWESTPTYIYCISFVSKKVTLSIEFDDSLVAESVTGTSGLTKTLTMKGSVNGTTLTKGENTLFEDTENSPTAPRVSSNELILRIDGQNKLATNYKGSLKIKITCGA